VFSIGGVPIGGDNPCRFIAEVSCNHNGSLALAHRLIDAAKEAGADFLKTQAYTPQELVDLRGDGPAPAQWGEQGWTMRALYEKAQTPLAWLPELFQHARDIGLVPFSSVFGAESLAVLEAAGCPAYKIAALDNGSKPLHAMVAATGKPVLVSLRREQRALLSYMPLDDRLAFLLCPEGYPQPASSFAFEGGDFADDECHDFYAPAAFLGLSSHNLDPRLPIAAVARGAKCLEYHVQLDDCPSELEANISLRVSEFARMVADVRATEVLCG